MKQIKKRAENQRSQPTKVSPKEDEHGINFIFPQDLSVGIIKVVGVGGGGCNAVRNMYLEGITNVTYAAFNTDSQQLVRCPVPVKLQLGADGLGAGGNPDKGREEAEQTRDRIRTLLDDGTKMVFVTASMGGGTGTGAAPVIAKIAKTAGALTVGVVTKPFTFEGRKRKEHAELGIKFLKNYVDSLVVIPNDKLLEVSEAKTTMLEAFRMADEVLKDGVEGIFGFISDAGLINLDFADVKPVMSDRGIAHMGVGRASGEDRVKDAIKNAVNSPLLETSIKGAKAVLLNITGGYDLGMHEVNDAADLIHQEADEDAIIIFGTAIKEDMENEIQVTLIATGFEDDLGASRLPKQSAQGQAPAPAAEGFSAEPKDVAVDTDSELTRSHYNAANDFPIPNFLKDKKFTL